MENRALRRIKGRGGDKAPGGVFFEPDIPEGPNFFLIMVASAAIHLLVLGAMGYLPGLIHKPKAVKIYQITMVSEPGPAGGGGKSVEAVKPPKKKPVEKPPEKDAVKIARKPEAPVKAVREKPPEKPKEKVEPKIEEAPVGPGQGPAGGGVEGAVKGPITIEGGVEFPFSFYIATIQKKIDGRWSNPNVRAKKPPQATVFFRIDKKGRISHVKVEESSGIGIFDRHAMSAVLNSNPLPELPEGFEGSSLGVHFTFISKD